MPAALFEESVIDASFGAQDSLRIGLIADTHMPGTIEALWAEVHDAFAGVDCILHAGDLHTADVIEELERLAPTYVATGNGDMNVVHPRLREVWLGEFAGHSVGMVHHFPTPARASEQKLAKRLTRHFAEQQPQTVIYGHTHLAEVHTAGAMLYINPGSATLPNNQSTRLGTVGVLELAPGRREVTLFQLATGGLDAIAHARIG